MSPLPSLRSVEAPRLRQLRTQGADSSLLDARVAWSEAEGLSRYARMIQHEDSCPQRGCLGCRIRVHAHILPTAQASGRWSTTDPSLVNFPSRDGFSVAWGMILPDPGTFWAHIDLSTLHLRIAAAYTNDADDLQAFQRGWDRHTLTACRMWGWGFEPPGHVLGCPDWTGKQDRRRRLAKVFGYALLLGKNEYAALESKDIEKEGLSRDEALSFARLYLKAKPQFVQARRAIWNECVRTHKARSFMGRLRRLYGEPETQAKDGWSHILQGGEQDIIQTILCDLMAQFPDSYLVLNSHDGLTWATKGGKVEILAHYEQAKPIVERTWSIQGKPVPIPADWEFILDTGETIKGVEGLV